VKQFSAAFQWIECSHLRITLPSAKYITFKAASSLGKATRAFKAQLIPLHEEMEFIEMYLAMQEKRYGNRVKQSVSIDPELHDAMVPAMILQPIVENAYAHGLSKLNCGGALVIAAHKEACRVTLSVLNSGVGLRADPWRRSPGQGVGLANIKSRLQLHYGVDHTMVICEADRNTVQVTITIPLTLSENSMEETARFGA
jgi:LytS/YehU family sensor histidine kinase